MKQLVLQLLKDALAQLFGIIPTKKGKLVLTQWALKRANEYGVNVKDLKDVFKHGEEVKERMIIRKYNSCEIGLTYKYDARRQALSCTGSSELSAGSVHPGG